MALEDAGVELDSLPRDRFQHYLEINFIEKYLSKHWRGILPEQRDELAQDVKLNVLNAIDRFEWDGETAFRSWLITIINNRCKSHLTRPDQVVMFGKNLELVGGVIVDDPSNGIDARRRLMQVMTLLEDGIICGSQADLFRLHYLDGMSVDAIAMNSDKEKKDVYAMITRLRANLLLELKGFEPDDTDHDFDIHSLISKQAMGHMVESDQWIIQAYFIDGHPLHDLFPESGYKRRTSFRTRIDTAYAKWVEIIKYLSSSHGGQ